MFAGEIHVYTATVGFHKLGAPGIVLVRMVMRTQAVEHTCLGLSIAVCWQGRLA